MKFNATTRQLFSDDMQLIKQLHCPFKMEWDQLESADNLAVVRTCSICKHPVVDTGQHTSASLEALVGEQPTACLKVDLNQNNLTIIHHHV